VILGYERRAWNREADPSGRGGALGTETCWGRDERRDPGSVGAGRVGRGRG